MECFGAEDSKEEESERDRDFENLYSIFKMESKMMENKQIIFELFSVSKFEMNSVIESLTKYILKKLESFVESLSNTGNFIFQWKESLTKIKDMVPYNGKEQLEYLREESLYTMKKREPIIHKWIPVECHAIIWNCSGYKNDPDITWSTEGRKQILWLASILKDPDNPRISTWSKLIHNISSFVEGLLKPKQQIPKGTVREIIHFLCTTFRLVNYEIGYINAKLTNIAEMTITTLVFAYAFKHLWEMKRNLRAEYKTKKDDKKSDLLKFFLDKVESRKLARGNWNRKEMRKIDLGFSKQYALNFIESVKQAILDDQDTYIESKFLERKEVLSHKSLFLLMNEKVTKELNSRPDKEILDQNNIVIQYICNRNDVMNKLFQSRWEEVSEIIYGEVVHNTKNLFLEKINTLTNFISNFLQTLSTKGEEGIDFDSDSNFELADKEFNVEHSTDLNVRESPCKAIVLYMQKYLDPNVTPEEFKSFFNSNFEVNGMEMIKHRETWILCDKPKDDTHVVDKGLFEKLTNTKMFDDTEKIFNINEYLKEFLSTLNCYEYELSKIEFGEMEMIKKLKDEHEALALSCPERCPSCGKLCDREIHPHNGKCQIKTGHLICSMGGRVWRNDKEKTAILFTCDDYKDSTEVRIPGKSMKWGDFKVQSGNEWDWELPTDEDYKILQQNNREIMKNIWNKFGRGILNYHAKAGTIIKYIPYTSFEDVLKAFQIFKFRICFVIDGTGSMRNDIDRARISVGQLIKQYREHGHGAMFAIVIYRDHCDGDDLIQNFPDECKFTKDHKSVQEFLQGVKVFGGGDGPEAVLDGLATAVKECNWDSTPGTKNIIIHIFDAPPHGNFPNYKLHRARSDKGNCCCCNHGGLCNFDWKKDVWDKMHRVKIQYYGINTGRNFPQFNMTMKDNLGELFGDIQTVEKEMVSDAVVQIFVDYRVP